MIAHAKITEVVKGQLVQTQVMEYNNGIKTKRIFGNPQEPNVPTELEWIHPKL